MNEKYIIFGAGITGLGAINYFIKEQIIAVIDNSPLKIGTLFHGIRVISFHEYLEKYRDIKIIVSIHSKNYFDVKKQLESNGVYDYFTSPPVIYGFDTPERLAERLLPDTSPKIVFYDTNPISIRMYEWLKGNSDKNCYFIKALKEMKQSVYEDRYPFIKLSDLSKNDTVVVTTNEVEEHIRERLNSFFGGKIYDVYKKTEPTHPELVQYRNKYQGQRCFVIGNGPSLRAEDLDTIEKNGDVSFAVNKIYRIFEKTKWRPTYYTCIDVADMDMSVERLKELVRSPVFLADYYYANVKYDTEINYFCMINRIFEDSGLIFSDDITLGVASGKTVTYAALQLACYMGFSEIYLLGVDFTWGENGTDTHFCKDYEDEKGRELQRTVAILDNDEIYEAYCTAKKYAQQHGIKIYNATRGGRLEVFERVEFDTLFEEKETE